MDRGLVQGVITLLTFGVFIGICIWAYRPGNRARFEEDARLPFEDDDIDRRTELAGETGDGR